MRTLCLRMCVRVCPLILLMRMRILNYVRAGITLSVGLCVRVTGLLQRMRTFWY